MIYSVLLPTNYTDEAYSKLYTIIRPHIADFRQKKADKIIPARERAMSALAYLLLCHALNEEYRYYGFPSFTFEANGKPCLNAPYDGIFFNLSHCRTGIACAVSSSPIGVDIQDIRKVKDSVIKKLVGNTQVSTESNAQSDAPNSINGTIAHNPQQQNIPHDANRFAAFWSRYEAYVKYTGEGVRLTPSDCGFLSDDFIHKNDISIVTYPLSHDISRATQPLQFNPLTAPDFSSYGEASADKKEAAEDTICAYLSAAYRCRNIGNSSTGYSPLGNVPMPVKVLDFSDFISKVK